MSVHVQALRSALHDAIQTYRPQAELFTIPLPGYDWEEFAHAKGEKVLWKRVPAPIGRKVLFRALGPASIGFHFHDVAEVLIGNRGVLFYTVGGASRALLAGDTYTSQPFEIHMAEFREPGEAYAYWTDLECDDLQISFFI